MQGDTIATCKLGARLHLCKTTLVTGDYMYLSVGGKTLQNVHKKFFSGNFLKIHIGQVLKRMERGRQQSIYVESEASPIHSWVLVFV